MGCASSRYNNVLSSAVAVLLLVAAATVARADCSANSDPIKCALDDPTFQQALKAASPVDPSQVKVFRERNAAVNQAGANVLPQAASVRTIPVGPHQIPALSLRLGFAATVRLTDAGGAAVSIKASQAGDENIVKPSSVRPPAKATVNAQAKPGEAEAKASDTAELPADAVVLVPKAIGATNLIVFPVGSDRPLVISVSVSSSHSARGAADYGADYRLAWMAGSERAADSTLTPALLAVLQGAPPAGFRALPLRGNDSVRAWESEGLSYVRVPRDAALLLPAYRSQASAEDGVRAYELAEKPASLVVSIDGVPTVLTVQEK